MSLQRSTRLRPAVHIATVGECSSLIAVSMVTMFMFSMIFALTASVRPKFSNCSVLCVCACMILSIPTCVVDACRLELNGDDVDEVGGPICRRTLPPCCRLS